MLVASMNLDVRTTIILFLMREKVMENVLIRDVKEGRASASRLEKACVALRMNAYLTYRYSAYLISNSHNVNLSVWLLTGGKQPSVRTCLTTTFLVRRHVCSDSTLPTIIANPASVSPASRNSRFRKEPH